MFKKILIAEDFDTYNVAIASALQSLEVSNPDQVYYCDDALLHIRKALQDGHPYDLLITDLSFRPDHKKTSINDGMALVAKTREVAPEMPIIVYSVENRMHPIRQLFEELNINGYVLKGRRNIPELKKAIQAVYDGERYKSPEILKGEEELSLGEIEQFDLTLLELLSRGISQNEIAAELQKENIQPNSISSVEKRLNRLKAILGAKNNIQLIVISKDLGLL